MTARARHDRGDRRIDPEAEWAQLIGAPGLQRMRRDLVRVLSGPDDGELPPVRPLW